MSEAFQILLPLTMAGVLLASGVAKLRSPDDLAGWAALGVPRVFRSEWLLRLHPWGEMAIGVALVLSGGVAGFVVAIATIGLMLAYLWLVVHALRKSENASCSCFGHQAPITGATVFRNAWLVALATATALVIWMNPLLGGVVTAVPPQGWPWVIAAAVVAATVGVVLWSGAERDEPRIERVAHDSAHRLDVSSDETDYIRTRTPAVPVWLADGTTVNLRKLAMRKAILLVAVSPSCGSCQPVHDRVPAWRELLPEVDVRLLLMLDPDDGEWTEYSEPQSLHDPNGYVRGSIADWGTPTAVLLGADGMLAGGPVTGFEAIDDFVGDVYESLHGSRPYPSATRAAVDSL